MSIRDRVRRMLADVTRETPRPQPPPPPAPSPLRIAAFGTLLALSERLKKTDRAGLASVDALKDARWSGREIARAVKALLEGEPEGTRGASWQRASDLLMARAFAAPPDESPSRPLVEALYLLRRTLLTPEQRDALRAVEAVLYRGAVPDGATFEDAAPCEHATEVRSVAGRIGWSVPLGHACTKVRVVAGETVRRGEAAFARERAEGLRAKEMAEHKAWLRDNADSVTVPEHPAVTLLREIEWSGKNRTLRGAAHGCPSCGGPGPFSVFGDARPGVHEPGCRLAAILAGSKPGERALSEVLAEARAAGYDEALQKGIAERNAMYSAHELGALADELDEDNYATAAKKLRAAIATIARLEEAAKEERAKGPAGVLLDLLAGVHSPVDQAEPEAAMRVRTLLGSILAEERKRGHAAGRAEAFEACAQMVEQADGERWDAQGIPEAIRTRAQQ